MNQAEEDAWIAREISRVPTMQRFRNAARAKAVVSGSTLLFHGNNFNFFTQPACYHNGLFPSWPRANASPLTRFSLLMSSHFFRQPQVHEYCASVPVRLIKRPALMRRRAKNESYWGMHRAKRREFEWHTD